MSTLKIICSNRRAGAALLELLKLLQHSLRFYFITSTRQQNPEVVQRGFVVRFRRDRPAKGGNRFGVFFLLAKYLPHIDV